MKKNLKFFLCLIVGLSSLAQTNAAQDELKFVPENRVFLQHSQKTNTVPMYLDTADATGECGIGLWVDEQLSIVLYHKNAQHFIFHLVPIRSELLMNHFQKIRKLKRKKITINTVKRKSRRT